MSGCPRCGIKSQLLSTTNDWKYYCQECDIRFDKDGVILLKTARRIYYFDGGDTYIHDKPIADSIRDATLYTEEV